MTARNVAVAVQLVFLSIPAVYGQSIDFSRDVRPILSENCFACHGFDGSSRAANLRLDTAEGATADLGGYAAIVPGDPNASELIKRVKSDDADELMPPESSHRKPLGNEAIRLLSEWIRQGAKYSQHWAFVRPEKTEVSTEDHPVDFFVRKRLGPSLNLSPPAAPHTLARRLAFDLTGLPPTGQQIERLASQPDKTGWEELIQELLNSPHFGERMAMWWLDAARYADTDGFQQDASRTNWPWRDWVVSAFNENMPFDQFTIEQFAGDLLPDATDEQRLATCFHRNHMNNGEGGRDPEESRVDYVLDRVNTFGTLWLGLTLGCTQCHDHKFDPISQRDYYSLAAYFNSIDESGAAGTKAGPYVEWQSESAIRDVRENEQLLAEVDAQITRLRGEADEPFRSWLAQQVELVTPGYEPWVKLPVVDLQTTEGYVLESADGETISASASTLPQDDYMVTCSAPPLSRITAIRLEVYPHQDHRDGKLSFSESGEFILTNFKLRLRRRGTAQYREVEIAGAIADVEGKGKDPKYGAISGTLDDDPRTGWTTRTHPGDVSHWAVFELKDPLILGDDEELDIILMQRSIENRELIGQFQLTCTDQRGSGLRSREPLLLEKLSAIVAGDSGFTPQRLSPELRSALFEQFLEDHEQLQSLVARRNRIAKQLAASKKAAGVLQVAVLKERAQPRRTFVLERGVWDAHGEQVSPGVLPVVLSAEGDDVSTRLNLGKWIVSTKNPLTARVIVNQVWQLFFGAGLVRTPNDFGLQGEAPTHPELLDWLAVDFMENGWDVKRLVRTIVTSQTYRQSSEISPELLELDPENRLLARGARFRLPAWMIRDARLAMSEQLNRRIGGPPVFPYQPPGVWKDQFMGRFTYEPTEGSGQYRRTLYAFWRRTSSPTFLFDAAMRRTCEVEQRRTNTPLHSLTLLNDLTGQEVARTLADEFVGRSDSDASECLRSLWFRVLGRKATQVELGVVAAQFAAALNYYAQHAEDARSLLSVGQLALGDDSRLPKRAAMMVVASLLLNLDECITHE